MHSQAPGKTPLAKHLQKAHSHPTSLTHIQKFHDAASLCSLAPSPQGLTNDDEVGVQSADGVSGSHVRVQLPLDRRANKFDNSAFVFVTRFASLNDRGFPSVDDIASYARAYQHDVRTKQTEVCDAEREGFHTPMCTLVTNSACWRVIMRALVPTPAKPGRYHIYSLHSASRLRLSASTRLGNEVSRPELSRT